MAKKRKHYGATPQDEVGYDIDSADLRAFRDDAREGLAQLLPEVRQAYGWAVEQAVLAKQRAEFKRAAPAERACSCASRTNHNDGAAIHDAVRRQQAADLAAWPAKVRRKRTPHEWESMYAEAMEQKRKESCNVPDTAAA